MAFRQWDMNHLVKFNSVASSELLDMYDNYLSDQLISESKELPHRTFAPSAFRCNRRSWFRLRGVEPDTVTVPDTVLNFSAEIGTACHRMIQSNLKAMLKDDWIDVMSYIYNFSKTDTFYTCTHDESQLETLVITDNPPVRFACDGLIRLHDKLYLIEIKSSEYASWNELTDPKPQHIDQVKCYCTLLNLDNVLFIYVDRQYGGLKCFEIHVSDTDKAQIRSQFKYVQDMVDKNLAPEGLPVGDSWCQANYCPYYRKCKEYG